MKKTDAVSLLKLMLTPVVLILVGLLLIFSPDSATTLLTQILGWILIAVGGAFGIAAVTSPGGLVGKVIGAVIFILAGMYMVSHPLQLAAFLGRFAGVLLMIQGLQDLLYMHRRLGSIFLPLLTAIAGGVLVVLPMTTSRLVFTGIGLVVLIIGIIMLIQRLRDRRQYHEPEDPNIIDAL